MYSWEAQRVPRPTLLALGSEMERMADTIPGAERTAGALTPERFQDRYSRLVIWAILLALALAVLSLRFHRLGEFPQGLTHDEGVDGVLALGVLEGEHAIFFLGPGNSGRDASTIYALALSTALFGRTLLAMHLPTALGSAGLVFVVFWLGRLLFGRDENGQPTPWRGLLIGGVGAGLLAVSLGQTIIGRTSFNNVAHMPLLLSLCLALLWWGWGQGSQGGRVWWRIALAGACAGLLVYTYVPARLTPLLFLLFGLSFLYPWTYGNDGRERSGKFFLYSRLFSRWRSEVPWVSIFVGMAVLLALPLLVHFALHPEHLFWRSNQLWVLDSDRSQGDPLAALWRNVWEHLMVLGFRGDLNWERNFAGQPMLKPWEAVFFWLGAAIVVRRWQRPANRLLFLWLGLLLLPAMLARDSAPPPNTLRMNGAAPAIYLLTGVGVWETFRYLRERLRTYRFIGAEKTKTAIVLGVVVGGSILTQGIFTYHTYFHRWAAAPETYRAFETDWTELAWTLNEQPADTDTVYLIAYRVDGHPSFSYLYQNEPLAHVVPANMPNLAQRLRSTLAANETLSRIRVVDWSADSPWTGDGDENIIVLLGKYGRSVGSDEFASFRIRNYIDINLDRSWTFYENLESREVLYDGGIIIRGIAIGHGEEQLSSQQLLNLGQSRSLWVGLQWEAHPDVKNDFAISLRLYDAEGAMSYQRDVVLGNANQARTGEWSAEEVVDTLFHLDFPAVLQSGDYELRLVVYDTETLTPTVDIDVWEPELVLARLSLAELH